MELNFTDRSTLKGYFTRNKVPTEQNFAEFINAMLNQQEDGIAKTQGNPLAIAATGDGAGPLKSLSLYRNFADTTPGYELSLNAFATTGDSGSAQPGLTISDGSGTHRLHIHDGTGYVGLGTVNPQAPLHIKGNLIRLEATTPGHWAEIDLYSGFATANQRNWNLAVEGNTGTFKVRQLNDARGLLNEPLSIDATDRVLLRQRSGTLHSAAGGSLVLDHENAGGASSIVFRSKTNRGSDYGFIQYQDASAVGGAGESARLTIGIMNDADDHLILSPSGNVGVKEATPDATLTVGRGIGAGGTAIFKGTNHASHFNYSTDEHTFIRGGKTASNVYLNDTGGNVGIGAASADFKLDVHGSVRLGGFANDENDAWPNIVWQRDTGNNWDEGLIKGSAAQDSAFNRAGFGIHMNSNRRFSFYSTGWDQLLHIEGATGNTWQKGSAEVGGLVVERDLTAHIDRDGALYRTGGQVYLTVDDNFYVRDTDGTSRFHFNSNNGTLTATTINAAIDQSKVVNPHIVTGMVVMWSGAANAIPSGWALCDGASGRPDLRGRFVLGYGNGPSTTNRTMNQNGGVESVALTVNHLPSHNHGINDPGHYHNWTASRQQAGTDDHNNTQELSKGDRGAADTMSKNTNTRTTGISIRHTGNNWAHENMPPFYVLAYIIKL